ncbi:SDR family NAD(P)-dependent oxidoreductase [Streptomyces sp. NPDC056390]|uniref:SDR family NAD(P)-dependent oxidoreductase n=1 Tax=Streptomyces sp. NPDC056390 TaxID=3345806 RepID=UPI0035E081D4
MTGRLDGKIALITGIAGGQGRAAAALFAAEGARVVGCDVRADDCQETVDQIVKAGGQAWATAPLDLSDSAAAKAWIDEAVEREGGIDILYNNASKPRFAPIPEMSDEDWQFTMHNELDLVYYACRAAWPHLVARGGGSIINTASVVGSFASPGTVGSGAHAAAKGGVLALTRVLANEGAPHGIRANSISPGMIATPATEPLLAAPGGPERYLKNVMIKRIGTSEDIAAAALFLASDESSWVTGTDQVVDGGFSAW